jgi:hypothetical protein
MLSSSFVRCVLPQAQYLLADSNLEPEDLLKLPRISKEDTDWGCYFDLLTNARDTVVGWHENSILSPIKGLDYPLNHAFQCEGCKSSATLKWFFDGRQTQRAFAL